MKKNIYSGRGQPLNCVHSLLFKTIFAKKSEKNRGTLLAIPGHCFKFRPILTLSLKICDSGGNNKRQVPQMFHLQPHWSAEQDIQDQDQTQSQGVQNRNDFPPLQPLLMLSQSWHTSTLEVSMFLHRRYEVASLRAADHLLDIAVGKNKSLLNTRIWLFRAIIRLA